jgi:VanZ family protein
VLAILALTLTRLGAGPRGAAPGICLFGLPCWLGHLATFTVLGVALAGWYATSDGAARSPQRVLVMLLLALWLFGALDELAQSQVGRDPEFGDWGMDMAGALLGLLGGGALLRAIVRQ